MPGPHDHLAELGRVPDEARPRAADSPDDLQARLERLPLNHPSSPYRDDGSRKPGPLDIDTDTAAIVVPAPALSGNDAAVGANVIPVGRGAPGAT